MLGNMPQTHPVAAVRRPMSSCGSPRRYRIGSRIRTRRGSAHHLSMRLADRVRDADADVCLLSRGMNDRLVVTHQRCERPLVSTTTQFPDGCWSGLTFRCHIRTGTRPYTPPTRASKPAPCQESCQSSCAVWSPEIGGERGWTLPPPSALLIYAQHNLGRSSGRGVGQGRDRAETGQRQGVRLGVGQGVLQAVEPGLRVPFRILI